ncbi:High-affinity methionine permease [Coniochaeta hoffmannii]|uniref:High-affinity methionine permease n=1 Tax=Coniochaeta hoffmannii TaxID=91930 RepID=A0AA38VZE0_9PEZI|nr:High-affinity methionine permease [Coniochaeta hoffmannii]
MASWRRPFGGRTEAAGTVPLDEGEVSDGSLHYVVGKGGNDSQPSYQEATGAPVEVDSPLGYNVGAITIIFLNISKMIGTGVYSTPASIYRGTGSVGLSMIYWAIGFFTSISSLSVYLEFASYFPNRSGSEVVYLEQAYPRPRWFFPTAFAVQTVILSFSSSNAIVLAQYLFRINGHHPTDWELKGVAIAGYTVAVLFVFFNTKFSYWFQNAVGIVKVLTLIFISITGLVVLGGNTRVADPQANFRHAFEGKATPYGLTNALVKIIFSYAGYENAFNVVNEVRNPVKQLKRNGFIALFIVTLLYIFANVAYFSAVPKKDIAGASQVAASLFFTAVFGSSNAVKGLNFLIALSAFGNLLAVLLGSSRLIRECGRQGVLPWPRFWASTKPFGTPTGPYLLKWILTIIMILAPPAGDAFNFVVDLQVYPSSFFSFLMGAGLYAVRWRRKRANLPPPTFRAWDVAVVFNILVALYLLVMPWYPPDGGQYAGDVSFWYATYVATGVALIVACGLYYAVWKYVLPRHGGYRLRQEVLALDNGAQSHRIIKVPIEDLARWDATHDVVGRPLQDYGSDSKESGRGKEGEDVGVISEKSVHG